MKKFFTFLMYLAAAAIVIAGVTLTTIRLNNARQQDNVTDGCTVNVSARLAGTDNEWTKELNAPAGAEIELRMEYANTGNKAHLGVSVWAELPEKMEYIDNSTYLQNAKYPNGITVAQNTVTAEGLNIGSYVGPTSEDPGATAVLKLTVKIPEDLPVDTQLTPAFKVCASSQTYDAGVAITIVDKDSVEFDPTQSIAQRPADYTFDEAEADTESDTDTTEAESITV